jgi:Flp pilus assembly pilin Flp
VTGPRRAGATNEEPTVRTLLNFLRREDGATAVEYAAALGVLILSLGAVSQLNNGTKATFEASGGQIGTYGTTTTAVGS